MASTCAGTSQRNSVTPGSTHTTRCPGPPLSGTPSSANHHGSHGTPHPGPTRRLGGHEQPVLLRAQRNASSSLINERTRPPSPAAPGHSTGIRVSSSGASWKSLVATAIHQRTAARCQESSSGYETNPNPLGRHGRELMHREVVLVVALGIPASAECVAPGRTGQGLRLGRLPGVVPMREPPAGLPECAVIQQSPSGDEFLRSRSSRRTSPTGREILPPVSAVVRPTPVHSQPAK